MNREIIPIQQIAQSIYLIRGQRVKFSQDLAILYGVATKVLNQAVKRSAVRFPADFVFQLKSKELANLKPQFVTSSWGGPRRASPYAFTEQGVAMFL
jgi:ORF6N domain